MELTAAEGRVLGCLIERAAVAPDAYPVTLNALRLACNQGSGRHPVVAYDDRTVEDTLMALKSKGLARFVSALGPERAIRYSHRADGRWRMGDAELAVLAVLLLGGPQTLGAVQAQVASLHPFDHAGEVEAVLDGLAARTPDPFAARLDSPAAGPRVRWVQVLAGEPQGTWPDETPEMALRPAVVLHDGPGSAPTYAELAARVAELERRLAAATQRPLTPGDRLGGAPPGGEPEVAGGDRRPHDSRSSEHDRALPAATNGWPADIADRLADIERRLARIEAELGALR